jgi:ABC-type uncharacterized transport system substrate-binding protein
MKQFNIFTYHLLIIICCACLYACHAPTQEKRIGIIVPIEHQSLDDIVAGFKDTLLQKTSLPLQFKVANAQGDINLQRAIIQQMKDQHYDLVVPVGLAATEASIAMIHDQPILSLAASLNESDRHKQTPCHTAIVHDEISPKKLLAFVHDAYPHISHITLIHSSAEKIYPDVKIAVQAGSSLGITIKPMMVNALQELYNIANAVPLNTQAILVLKDNLIVSGIGTLEILAATRHIPLITADQGSVNNGAAFALGVSERGIGVEGAKLAALILTGKPICELPIVEVKQLTVFINQKALAKEHQIAEPLENIAKKYSYRVQFVTSTGKSF